MMKFKNAFSRNISKTSNQNQRNPLKTINEMADELCVKPAQLRALLALRNGPKPVLKVHSNTSANNTWYEPIEVKK